MQAHAAAVSRADASSNRDAAASRADALSSAVTAGTTAMAPVRADRDALLRNWKSAAAEIAADVTTLTAEAEALGPVVSEKWVAGEDGVALAPRLDALLDRAGDAERRARALAAALS